MKTHYTLMDELMASPTAPLSAAQLQAHLIPMLDGLRALEQDQQPTIHHWRALSDAVNMLETLVNLGVCADESGLLNDAARSMGEAGTRHLRTGAPIRLDGPGISAVRAVLEDYGQLIPQLPARVMVRCHRLTELRIARIAAGQRKQHDIVVNL